MEKFFFLSDEQLETTRVSRTKLFECILSENLFYVIPYMLQKGPHTHSFRFYN